MTQSISRFTNPANLASATDATDWPTGEFIQRHIGPQPADIDRMLRVLGVASLDQLIDRTVPAAIKLQQPLAIETVQSEYTVLNKLKQIASQNQVFRSYIGMGYANCITPTVIQRNILENPGWYTQYTPYQPEISQGRLEALLNYQTVIMDLTGMAIANASLLDEGTAAAEAMSMSYGIQKTKFNTFWISEACHPQTIDVIKTRAIPLGIEVVIGNHKNIDFSQEIFGMLLQYPATDGAIYNYQEVIEKAHRAGAIEIGRAHV